MCTLGLTLATPVTALAQGKALGIPWPTFHHDPQHTGLSHFDTTANSGTLAWKLTTGSFVTSSPAIGVDNSIYVGSADGHVYALNPDGTIRWAFSTPGEADRPTVARDGTIYLASGFNLYAVNSDGTEKWVFSRTPSCRTRPL
jgi:outer membrane protein assembly factor BamB